MTATLRQLIFSDPSMWGTMRRRPAWKDKSGGEWRLSSSRSSTLYCRERSLTNFHACPSSRFTHRSLRCFMQISGRSLSPSKHILDIRLQNRMSGNDEICILPYHPVCCDRQGRGLAEETPVAAQAPPCNRPSQSTHRTSCGNQDKSGQFVCYETGHCCLLVTRCGS